MARLCVKDTKALAITCCKGRRLGRDQFMWKRKLWLRARVLNLALANDVSIYPLAALLVCDPLLADNRQLYEILDPDSIAQKSEGGDAPDIGNLLSKMVSPETSSPTSFFTHVFRLVRPSAPVSPYTQEDPFALGRNAPTFLLFGPETSITKKLALRLITSKDSTLETVGLVKGKPGGMGGGVTVRYAQEHLNLLPVRRVRPRLLIEGPRGTVFHPDVAHVAERVDGLICYVDASRTGTDSVPDTLELCAMLRTLPEYHAPPLLVLATHLHTSDHKSRKEGRDSNRKEAAYPPNPGADNVPDALELCAMPRNHREHRSQARPLFASNVNSPDFKSRNESRDCSDNRREASHLPHPPSVLLDNLSSLDLPWAVCSVEVSSLRGINLGLNWLLRRTLKTLNS
ncbi:uncharacterized protein LOC143029819 isoform X2 [Oratosquilla oratoria]